MKYLCLWLQLEGMCDLYQDVTDNLVTCISVKRQLKRDELPAEPSRPVRRIQTQARAILRYFRPSCTPVSRQQETRPAPRTHANRLGVPASTVAALAALSGFPAPHTVREV